MRVLINNAIQDVFYKIEDDVKFKIDYMEKYMDLFNEYKKHNVILNDSFDDVIWKVKTHVKCKSLKFEFNELDFARTMGDSMSMHEFVVAVKAYCLYKLKEQDSPSLNESLRKFKHLCKVTLFFDSRFTTAFKEYFRKDYNRTGIKFIRDFFCDFCELASMDSRYIDMMEKMSGFVKPKKQRELPSFESMFKMNDIIEDFYSKRNTLYKGLKEKYFPIILWWKITSVIPLRPIELTLIPNELVERTETETGVKYIIKLNRSKSKGGVKEFDIKRHSFEESFELKPIETTEEIYNLIKEYKDMVDYYDDIEDGTFPGIPAKKREYLLSYRSYFKQMNEQSQKGIIVRKVFKDEMDTLKFGKILSQFFEEVVTGIYGIQVVEKLEEANTSNLIHKIDSMDTRHFAIMNMVLSGIEPTIIRELAAHAKIDTTYGYSRHQKEYARNLILSMARKQSKNSSIENLADRIICEDGGEQISLSAKRYQLAKLKDDAYASKFKKVAKGYCLYQGDDITPCILCAGNHEKCSHYISNDGDGFLDMLQVQKEMNHKMNVEIETLEWLMRNYDKVENYASKYHATLNKIKAYIDNEIKFRAKYGVFEDFE